MRRLLSLLAFVPIVVVSLVAQQAQNPSPMVEHTRRHERLAAEPAPAGTRTALSPGTLFVPAGVTRRDVPLLVHFHGGALPAEAAAVANKISIAEYAELMHTLLGERAWLLSRIGDEKGLAKVRRRLARRLGCDKPFESKPDDAALRAAARALIEAGGKADPPRGARLAAWLDGAQILAPLAPEPVCLALECEAQALDDPGRSECWTQSLRCRRHSRQSRGDDHHAGRGDRKGAPADGRPG